MLSNLAARALDKTLYARVCETFLECLEHTERNSGRMFAYVLSNLKDIESPEYKEIVCKTILAPLIVSIGKELTTEIPEASKSTVETIVKKCTLLRRLLYTMNKNK